MTELSRLGSPVGPGANPEGGCFKEMWRSDLTVSQPASPPDYTGPRSAGTAILLLMMSGQQSAWHTVRSAELRLHHRGQPAAVGCWKRMTQRHNTFAWHQHHQPVSRPQVVVVPPQYCQWARPRR